MFAPAPARRVAATPKKPSRFARVEHATPASDVKTSAELFCNFGAAVEAVSNVLQDQVRHRGAARSLPRTAPHAPPLLRGCVVGLQLDAIQNLFLNPLAAQVEHAGAVSVRATQPWAPRLATSSSPCCVGSLVVVTVLLWGTGWCRASRLRLRVVTRASRSCSKRMRTWRPRSATTLLHEPTPRVPPLLKPPWLGYD